MPETQEITVQDAIEELRLRANLSMSQLACKPAVNNNMGLRDQAMIYATLDAMANDLEKGELWIHEFPELRMLSSAMPQGRRDKKNHEQEEET